MRTAVIYNFLLEANIMASLAILLMLGIRRFLRRPLGNGPIRFGWLLAAIRLLCPLTLPNPFIGQIRAQHAHDLAIRPIATQIQRRVEDGLGDLYWFTRSTLGIPEENGVARGAYKLYSGAWNGNLARWLMILYFAGAALVLGWFLFSNVRFLLRLKRNRIEALSGEMYDRYLALCERRKVKPVPVYLTDPLPSACLAGVLRPYIALPITVSQQDMLQVLDHEICHYKGKDHIWALVRLACCVIHWFNPLVWIGAKCSCTDGELHCDDRVTRGMTGEERQRYAGILVLAAAKKTAPGVPVLATGMTMTGKKLKSRVQGILTGKKAVRWLSVGFMVLASMLLVCAFATAEYFHSAPIPRIDLAAIPPSRPLPDEEAAQAYAREIAALPFLGADTKGAEWTVSTLSLEPDIWQVEAVQEKGEYFAVEATKDGHVRQIVQGSPFYWNMSNDVFYNGTDHPWASDRLKAFFADMMAAFYPDETPDWEKWKISYSRDQKNTTIAIMEMPLDQGRHILVTVQLSPEFRLLDCGEGHG
ncbi:MAG: M56 family metallopeptidase [Clostridia bacterium]|nr:M56 family metallopeptidase [Clostridia bacterium]